MHNTEVKYTGDDVEVLAETIFGEVQNTHDFSLTTHMALANVVRNRVDLHINASIPEACKDCKKRWYLSSSNVSLDKEITLFWKIRDRVRHVLSGEWPDITEGCIVCHGPYFKPYHVAYSGPKKVFGNYSFYSWSLPEK